MILFDDVVQVGTISNLDGMVPTVIEFVIHAHAPQSGMGGLEAIQGNHSRLAVALESFTEEGLGGGDVTRSTEVGFDGFALFINSAVEVHPLTAYLEVGLVHPPGIAHRTLVGLPAFLELWNVAYDPAQDRARGDADAKFPGQLGQVPVTKLRACLKSRMRGHVIVGVMTISTDVDKLYDTDLTDAAWALIAPMLPAARRGGRPRKINIRAVLNAIFYLLRTGCQWRLLPREFPGWSTVYHYFQAWKNAGVWTCIQRSMYQQARRQAGRAACPSVVIMDGQSVKTTERGDIRGFDAHKRVKGRKRHILVDTFRAVDRMQSGAS